MLGNPLTNGHDDVNARIPFAHLKALISDEVYEVNFLPSIVLRLLIVLAN